MQESWQERARGAKIGLDEKPEIPRFFQKRDGTICHADPAFSSQGRYDHFDTCPYSIGTPLLYRMRAKKSREIKLVLIYIFRK